MTKNKIYAVFAILALTASVVSYNYFNSSEITPPNKNTSLPEIKKTDEKQNQSAPQIKEVETALEEAKTPLKPTLEKIETKLKNLETFDSFLAKYPGFKPNKSTEELIKAEDKKIKELTKNCMEDLGHTYIVEEDIIPDPKLSIDEILMLVENSPANQNLKKMSPAELESYNIALYGTSNPNETADEDLGDEYGGCAGQATQKVKANSALQAYDKLRDEYRELEESIDNDQRVIASTKSWVNCMNKKGYAFNSPNTVMTINSIYTGFKKEEGLEAEIDEPTEENYTNAAEYERAVNIQIAKKLDDKSYNTLQKDYNSCIDESKLTQVKQAVLTEYENKFVDMHRDQLEK